MSFSKEDLMSKKEPELNKLAAEYGVDLRTDSASKAQVVEALLEAQAELEAPAEVVIEEAPAATEEVVAAPAEKAEQRFRIIVHNQEGVDAGKFVKVQVNGTMFAIPREREVVVPASVIEVLNNAVLVRTEYEDGKQVEVPARRFPYTVLGKA